MKVFLVSALIAGVLAAVIIKIKKEYRYQITFAYFIAVILLNTVVNVYGIDKVQNFHTTVNQLVYQEEYADNKEYPDALINLLIGGKTVYMKDDEETLYTVTLKNFEWLYSYYHYRNPSEYFRHYGSNVVHDKTLNNSVINAEKQKDFEDIGYANDMLRNVCLYHPDNTGAADYFYHYAYYRAYVNSMHIYVNFDGITDKDELVLLWQLQTGNEGDETEDLYLMTKDYYDSIRDEIQISE